MSHSHTHDGHGHHGSYLERKGGWITTIFDWATTVDHKKIGVMYLFTILFMFFLGGAAALAVRMELLVPTTIDAAGQIQGQMFKPADATANPSPARRFGASARLSPPIAGPTVSMVPASATASAVSFVAVRRSCRNTAARTATSAGCR